MTEVEEGNEEGRKEKGHQQQIHPIQIQFTLLPAGPFQIPNFHASGGRVDMAKEPAGQHFIFDYYLFFALSTPFPGCLFNTCPRGGESPNSKLVHLSQRHKNGWCWTLDMLILRKLFPRKQFLPPNMVLVHTASDI
jgi:hypothetical protein